MIFYILTCSDAFPCIWKIRLEQSFHCKKCSFNVCTIPAPELCKDIFENHDIVDGIFLQIKSSAATLTLLQELFSLQRKYLFNNFFLQYHQQAKFWRVSLLQSYWKNCLYTVTLTLFRNMYTCNMYPGIYKSSNGYKICPWYHHVYKVIHLNIWISQFFEKDISNYLTVKCFVSSCSILEPLVPTTNYSDR